MLMLDQRRVALILIGGMSAVTALLTIIYLLTNTSPEAIVPTGAIAVVFGALAWLYWRGWEPARYLATLAITLTAAATLPTDQQFVAVFIPAAFALALADTRWVLATGLGLIAALLLRDGLDGALDGAYAETGNLSSYLIVLGAVVLAGVALDGARRAAERGAQQAEAERARAEQRAAEVERQAAELNAQNARQRELIELVSTLETPAVSVADGVLLAPLVGNLDSRRAEQVTRRLLAEVHSRRVRLVILDIAGVAAVDTAVAGALTGTVRSLRLLGCEVVLTGISAAVAATLTTIGVSLADLAVAATPQDALRLHAEGADAG